MLHTVYSFLKRFPVCIAWWPNLARLRVTKKGCSSPWVLDLLAGGAILCFLINSRRVSVNMAILSILLQGSKGLKDSTSLAWFRVLHGLSSVFLSLLLNAFYSSCVQKDLCRIQWTSASGLLHASLATAPTLDPGLSSGLSSGIITLRSPFPRPSQMV